MKHTSATAINFLHYGKPLRFELPNVWKEQAMLMKPDWARGWLPSPEPWKIPTIRWLYRGDIYTFKAGPMQSLIAHAVIETIDEIHEANRHPRLIVMPLDYWNLVLSDLKPISLLGGSWNDRELFGYKVEISQRDFYLMDDTGTVWR